MRASGSQTYTDLIHLIFRRADVLHITGQWQDENFHVFNCARPRAQLMSVSIACAPGPTTLGNMWAQTVRWLSVS